MGTDDAARLLAWFDAACARVDAGRLAANGLGDVPPGAAVMALGKVAHRQLRAVLAARPDLVPLVSVGTDAGPETWARAGDHPIVGERSFAAGEELLRAARGADGREILLLLSGGGSALAEVPAAGLTEDDVAEAHRVLLGAGLEIGALNVVRRALSAVKGGGLARAAPRSTWHVLALSDVPKDDAAALASGPCVDVVEIPGLAHRLCERAGVFGRLPRRVQARLVAGPEVRGGAFPEVRWTWLGNARSLARAVEAVIAESAPEVPVTVLAPVTEPVEVLAQRYAQWAADRAGSGPAVLVATGEPTLKIAGDGAGGRAQQLALMVAASIAGLGATFLAAGTDGRDGPTEHAGAIVDGETADRAGEALEEGIRRFDSAPLVERLGAAIPRREAVTHLGEVHLLIVR